MQVALPQSTPVSTPGVPLEYPSSNRLAAHAGIACAAAKAMSEAAQVTAYSRIKMVDVTARLIASANYASKQPTKSGSGRK